jgi:hypothetical protein
MQKTIYINLGVVMATIATSLIAGTVLIYDCTQVAKIKKKERSESKSGRVYYGSYDGLFLHYKSED